MRTITVVSVARSDYSVLRPVLNAIEQATDLSLRLVASGTHLSLDFGMTVDEMIKDGFDRIERVPTHGEFDGPEGIAQATARGVTGFAALYARDRPELLLLMGDRFEMFAAAVAALPFRIPIAHIHGGELSQGAIDDAMRHAITKFSHLHYVATEESARRVIQLGEAPWRVTVCGAPALDNLGGIELLPAEALAKRFTISVDPAPLLVTFHPTTLEYENTERDTSALLDSLAASGAPVVFTQPNADTEGWRITAMIEQFVACRENAWLVPNLGLQGYFSLLKLAAAMVGNSSSGIIEAASFGLPVVNIGNRQRGRQCGGNVIHCESARDEIAAAIRQATAEAFRDSLCGMKNIYGDGKASGRIVEGLRAAALNAELTAKTFQDLLA